MNEKRFIGMYHNDSELIAKIDDLKMQGIDGGNIYVVTQEDGDVAMFKSKDYSDAHVNHESWFDRFINFLTGESHVRGVMHDAGVPDADMDNYYTDIQNGGKLLYVDEGEVGRLHSTDGNSFGLNSAATDPNLGANFVSEFDNNEISSTGAFQDSLMNERTGENFGRAGGEALRSESSYETPPNSRITEANRFNTGETEEKMRLHEERLNVDKEEVERGEISLHKDVVAEEQKFDVPVTREEVYIERRPVNESKTDDYTMRQDDETIRVPIAEERLEVTKTPYVSEEIVVGKRKVQDTETVDETVRHEEVRFEKTGDVNVDAEEKFKNEFKNEFQNDTTMRNSKDNRSF